LSHEPQLNAYSKPLPAAPLTPRLHKQGVRTHVLLVLAMGMIIAVVTTLFSVLLQHRLRAQATKDLSLDLTHSVVTFENLQTERLAALDRENALLSDLPTLKALMTSGDDRTIQDGAVEFWQLSGNDLFALTDPAGRVVALYTHSNPPDTQLQTALARLVAASDKHFLIDSNALYACSRRPLYFGSHEDGTLLGYVISGISIERTVRQISQPTGVEATFLSNGHVLTSTLPTTLQSSLTNPLLLSATPQQPVIVTLGNEHYLAATEDLSASATSPLQLVLLKSFGPAEAWMRRMDRLVLSTGLLAILAGTAFMIAIAGLLTRPLEELSQGVRAFGMGDSRYRIPTSGTREVLQLSLAFASMRKEIEEKNRALLESERLATIGRMASSVSHDLRHYLAAVYANSEFLASGRLSEEERTEIFADIRTAVHGTTDMIESLLIFSRTGRSIKKSPEQVSTIVSRAVALLRAHPDADGVSLTTSCDGPEKTSAFVDAKQIERALYNLLLNACQAARAHTTEPAVSITLEVQGEYIIARVMDNGAGISESVRNRLFEPFVSEGRQKGTGLGLTLASCIAEEHGGEVVLVSSRPGETIFQMTLVRAAYTTGESTPLAPESSEKVNSHEKLST
jgi:signal transduction histidine kinase